MKRFRSKIATVLIAMGLVASSTSALARNNPPGPAGGHGTNWHNPPGPKGGPGASPNRPGHPVYVSRVAWIWNPTLACWSYDDDSNPPGPAGGRGTNWENPPGPAGGPGASPNRRLCY